MKAKWEDIQQKIRVISGFVDPLKIVEPFNLGEREKYIFFWYEKCDKEDTEAVFMSKSDYDIIVRYIHELESALNFHMREAYDLAEDKEKNEEVIRHLKELIKKEMKNETD